MIFVITICWPWTLGIRGQLNNIKIIYPIYNKNDSTSLTDMISASMWYHVLTLILALDSYLMHIQYLCVWVQSLQFCTIDALILWTWEHVSISYYTNILAHSLLSEDHSRAVWIWGRVQNSMSQPNWNHYIVLLSRYLVWSDSDTSLQQSE